MLMEINHRSAVQNWTDHTHTPHVLFLLKFKDSWAKNAKRFFHYLHTVMSFQTVWLSSVEHSEDNDLKTTGNTRSPQKTSQNEGEKFLFLFLGELSFKKHIGQIKVH